jgi:hypothetical protein
MSRVIVSAVVVVAIGADAWPDPRRHEIEQASARGGRLRKAELRPAMKAIVPKLGRCYEQARRHDPQISGVIDTKLTVRNEPHLGMMLTVNGFDTDGALGESPDFLACVKATFESAVLPPIATRGTLDIIYPSTFAPQPPDNRDTSTVDGARRASDDGRWSDALANAQRGLKLTSLDGPHRRQLIEIAGLAACRLKDGPRARRFFALASPEFEDRLRQACLAAAIDLD